MSSTPIKAPHVTKLSASQVQVVRRYVHSMALEQGGMAFDPESFGLLRDMVTSLPACRDLAPWDLLSIVVDVAMKFGAKAVQGEVASPAAEHDEQAVSYLVGFLESLPRTYVVRFELPGVPYWGDFSVQLADNVAMTSRRPSSDAQVQNALVRALRGQSQEADVAVGLELTLQGYASASPESPVVAEALALLKQVLHLLKHAGVLTPVHWEDRRARVEVLDVSDGSTKGITLPDQLAKALGALGPDQKSLQVMDLSAGTLLTRSFRSPKTDAEWVNAVTHSSRLVSRYFANRHLTGFARVAAAIEWYEDSLLNNDQSMAFLAACIGLESIFGEESTGMSEMSQRLGDRYSFMLGKDRDHRSRLASEFKEVLKLRGELVHARRSRLRPKDRAQLDKVRDMLWRSISHEMRPFLSEAP